MAQLQQVTSQSQFDELLKKAGRCLTVVHFQAPWAPQCAMMNDVMSELSKEHTTSSFVTLEAEEVPEVSEKYEISSVPTILFFKGGEKVDRLDGAHAPELSKKVQRLAVSGGPAAGEVAPRRNLNERLKELTSAAPCMLFMKGSPQEPRCGFSRTIVGLLKEHSIQFSSFDILSDDEVRQGLKTYSNWPTYPQLYANGELVGGVDIVKELAESGELQNTCPKSLSLEDRLKAVINRGPVMLFMKGNKQEARCGFSRQILELLNGAGVEYDTFDILSDEEFVVRSLPALSKLHRLVRQQPQLKGGRPQRQTSLWGGAQNNGSDYIIMHETEPAPDAFDVYMLYGRQKVLPEDVIKDFQEIFACHGMTAFFRLPQTQELCS